MTVTTRRERRDQQRRQQQRRESQGGGGSRPRRGPSQLWIALSVVVILIALVLVGRAAGVFDPPAASAIDPNATAYDAAGQTMGEHMADLGNAHTSPPGAKVDYRSLPPTSGQHWAAPQAPTPWGTKRAWLRWEVTIHNLEHGGIVMVYASSLSSTDVDFLRGIVRQLNTAGYSKIVLEPWPDMPKDQKVILTAWNWILRLPTLDQTQIIKFTRAHHGGAGEAPEANTP